MLKIYIAGPYTTGGQAPNVQAAMLAWHELADLHLAPFCPHLSHFLEILRSRPYAEWMLQDLEWLRCCDLFLRLPGPSVGADTEEALARQLGIPAFYSVAAVREYLDELQP